MRLYRSVLSLAAVLLSTGFFTACEKSSPSSTALKTPPKTFRVDGDVVLEGRWKLVAGKYEDFDFREENTVQIICFEEEDEDADGRDCMEYVASVVTVDSRSYLLLRRYGYKVTEWSNLKIKAKGRTLKTDISIEISLRDKTATRSERHNPGIIDNPASARFVLQ